MDESETKKIHIQTLRVSGNVGTFTVQTVLFNVKWNFTIIEFDFGLAFTNKHSRKINVNKIKIQFEYT